MLSNDDILLVGALGFVALGVFFFLMLFYSRRPAPGKPVVGRKDDITYLARECADKVGRQLQTKIFNKKEVFFLGVASAVIGEFSGMSLELPKAVLTVDGFMISFLIIAWSMTINRTPAIFSNFDYFKERIGESMKDNKTVKELAQGEEPTDPEGARVFLTALSTPIMQRGMIGKAFKTAIWALVFSVGSSLCLFGFQTEPPVLSIFIIYGFAKAICIMSLLLGMYIILKTFSLTEEVLFETETNAFGKSLKKFLESVLSDKEKSN